MKLKDIFRGMERAVFYESIITVTGNREVVIENCTHVYECNEIMIRLRTPDGDVSIWGEGLITSSFREGIVKVTGKITSLEISERGSTANA